MLVSMIEWKIQDLTYIVGTFIQQVYAIESYRNPGAGRKSGLKGRDKHMINRPPRPPVVVASLLVELKSLNLFFGINEFHIAIGEFQLSHEYLKAVGDRVVIGADSRQRCLAGGVVIQQRQLIRRELGCNFVSKH